MDFIDLTGDFEEETKSLRQQDRQRREEIIVLDDSDEAYSPSIFETPIKPPAPTPASTAPNTAPKSAPRKSNTKTSTKKPTQNRFSSWRDGQDFAELEPAETPTPEREKKKRRLEEAEEKQIGDRIQELARSVGWSQPRRSDDRTTRRYTTATPYRYNQERLTACDICGDKSPIYETTKLRCKHRHCNSCLELNFQMVINDPNAWPAKCCRPLEQDLAMNVLSAEEFGKYLDVKREKEHMTSTNCFNCQRGIPDINIIGNSTAFCAFCENVTCVHCTKAMHEGACLLDPETEKLLNMAQGKRWSKCPKCSNMVERNTGCNSMMCRCGMNFCYKCGRQMNICSTSGNCQQIAFQSAMWQNQAPHQPMQTKPEEIERYRQNSMQKEANLLAERNQMAQQNSQALQKQQVVSEIVSLRAKLEGKSDKTKDRSPNSKTPILQTPNSKSPTSGQPLLSSTPTEPDSPSKIQSLKRFPALKKALEAKTQKVPTTPTPTPLPKPSSIMDRYQKSHPALFRTADKIPTVNHTAPLSQPTVELPPINFTAFVDEVQNPPDLSHLPSMFGLFNQNNMMAPRSDIQDTYDYHNIQTFDFDRFLNPDDFGPAF